MDRGVGLQPRSFAAELIFHLIRRLSGKILITHRIIMEKVSEMIDEY